MSCIFSLAAAQSAQMMSRHASFYSPLTSMWGTAFGGILGMIMAIPLTAFGVVFWRLLKERYIEEWV